MSVKWKWTYMYEVMSISHPVLVVHACTLGSMNVCVARSSEIRSRPCWKDSAALPSTAPRTSRYA